MKVQLFKPSLPEIKRYNDLMPRLWKTGMLSNFSYYAEKMEKQAKKYLNTDNLAVVGSCDTGLIIAISSLDLPAGSEVLVPSFTFNSTVNAVVWNNLKPVFLDIDKETLCIDPTDVERKITKETKLIIGTHVFGNPCDVSRLQAISRKNKIPLIFDSAQAYGSKYKDKKVGKFGDIEVFSFSSTKAVTSAEGGIIVTKNKDMLRKVLLGRNFGFLDNYNTERIGINGKISEFNAALGTLLIPKIDSVVKKRNKLARRYKTQLKGVGDIRFQKINKVDVTTYKDFCILTVKRDALVRFLTNCGIETRNYFTPIHITDMYKNENYYLPNTDSVSRSCVCIPLFNDMTKKQQDYVVSKIKYFFKQEGDK